MTGPAPDCALGLFLPLWPALPSLPALLVALRPPGGQEEEAPHRTEAPGGPPTPPQPPQPLTAACNPPTLMYLSLAEPQL